MTPLQHARYFPPMDPLPERVETLQRRLMELTDPRARAEIHLDLGAMAVRDGRLDHAGRHFREALVLEPRLERARALLHELGEVSRIQVSRVGRRASMRSLLGRIRRG